MSDPRTGMGGESAAAARVAAMMPTAAEAPAATARAVQPALHDLDRDGRVALLDASLEVELRELARATRAPVFRELDDVAWSVGAVPGVTVYRTRLAPDEAGARIAGLTADLELIGPVTWWAGPSAAPPDLREHLVAAGFHLEDDEAGMVADLEHLVADLPRPAGLVMAEVEQAGGALDDALLEGWLEVNSRTLGWPDEKRDRRRDLYRTDDRRPLPWRHIVASLNGEPVAASRVLISHGVAMVHGVSTVPEARRQGIGTAVTAAGLAVARRSGCRIGVLQASSLGQGPYRRLGFETVARYGRFVRDPAHRAGTPAAALALGERPTA